MKNYLLTACAALALLSAACKKNSDSPSPSAGNDTIPAAPTTAADIAAANTATAAIHNYAALVLANYNENVSTAQALQTAVNTFLASPSQANLNAARLAWRAARVPYSRSEAYRFYGGPIDGEDGPEGLINSWPIDETYIDGGAGDSSYITHVNKPITKEALIAANGANGDENISTGFHAIEFLLWGKDDNPDGPGDRLYTDFSTADFADRRRQYLKVVTDLLVENLTQVRDAWQPGAAYHTAFTKTMSRNTALSHIFRGMGALAHAETGGERTRVAVDLKDPQHEQSCFSDNTTDDIINNVQGIVDVYNGVIRKLDGTTSLQDSSTYKLVTLRNPAKADAAKASLDQALLTAKALPALFDKTVTEDPSKITAVSDALDASALRLVDAAQVYGISVSTSGD